MGIIVNDSIPLSIGTNKTQCYFNIGYQPIILNKHPSIKSTYIVSTTFDIYFDHDSYINGGTSIDRKNMSITVNSNEVNENLYTLLYTKVKLDYVSIINM
jgi:hypothetical protein